MPRRTTYEPLQPSPHPRWLVVRNMHRAVLEHHQLAPHADLRGAFVKAMAAHVDEGWQLETFASSQGCAFCSRGDERRVITVEYADPMGPGASRPFP